MADGIVELGRAYDYDTHGSVPERQQREYVELAERLGVLDYVRRRFVFCGTPDEVEGQVRAAMDAGATRFDGAIDAELPEHEERITAWGRLVLPRFREA
jgi:alkanesulfonate monooxygenase SsuD/methylene tetrahydromethanopterin reductase-like flavin-dependent oxidoreductase (luciferase family)